jgi:predicted DsbA family dithiol-disulfide isomerase/uncharacterized membrane protein
MSKAKNGKREDKGRRKERRLQPPDLKRGLLWVTVVLAVAGIALALYATSTTIQIEKVGVVEASGCSINEFINCDVAHGSSYALFLGIPVAWWGFLFYLWAGLASVYALFTSNKNNAAAAVASVWVLSLGAVLFSVYKAINLYQLGVVCIVCVGMYAVNIGIAVLVPFAFGLSPGKMGSFLVDYIKGFFGQDSNLEFSPNPRLIGLLIVAIFGFGFIGMKNYTDENFQRPDIDIDNFMRAHYRQPAVEVNVNPDTPVWGNPDAPVTIVEFGDFQCPSCQQAAFHLRPSLFEFHDDVRLYYMHYPLDNTINTDMQRQLHVNAGIAAKAAVCAAERDDFWEYHDDVFRNQATLNRNMLVQFAEDRGWDVGAFNACLDSAETTERVTEDIAEGHRIGVGSTPTVIVNGRKIAGTYWRSSEVVRTLVREELERSR